jgi:hypothetical protein
VDVFTNSSTPTNACTLTHTLPPRLLRSGQACSRQPGDNQSETKAASNLRGRPRRATNGRGARSGERRCRTDVRHRRVHQTHQTHSVKSIPFLPLQVRVLELEHHTKHVVECVGPRSGHRGRRRRQGQHRPWWGSARDWRWAWQNGDRVTTPSTDRVGLQNIPQ